MTKENILEKLYSVQNGYTSVDTVIQLIEQDILERKYSRNHDENRLIGIKHILKIGETSGISKTWLQGFKIGDKQVVTNGYTMAVLNDELPIPQCIAPDVNYIEALNKFIQEAHQCEHVQGINFPNYQKLYGWYKIEKSRGNKQPKYYFERGQRCWNVQYLLDAMRLFKCPVIYGFNPQNTFLIIADKDDKSLNEFAIVMGMNSQTQNPTIM